MLTLEAESHDVLGRLALAETLTANRLTARLGRLNEKRSAVAQKRANAAEALALAQERERKCVARAETELDIVLLGSQS